MTIRTITIDFRQNGTLSVMTFFTNGEHISAEGTIDSLRVLLPPAVLAEMITRCASLVDACQSIRDTRRHLTGV